METYFYSFQPPTPILSSQIVHAQNFHVWNSLLSSLTIAISDNRLYLYRTSYSKDVWTSEKYNRLSQQRPGLLLLLFDSFVCSDVYGFCDYMESV